MVNREAILLGIVTILLAVMIAFKPEGSVVDVNCVRAGGARTAAYDLLAHGRLAEAREQAELANSLCPADSPSLREVLVTTYAELGMCDEAKNVRRDIDQTPFPPSAVEAARVAKVLCEDATDVVKGPAFTQDGDRAFASGDFNAAYTAYVNAWTVQHDNYAALAKAGVCRARLGDAIGARRLYERALAKDLAFRVNAQDGWDLEGASWVASNDAAVICMTGAYMVVDLHAVTSRIVQHPGGTQCTVSPDATRLRIGSEMVDVATNAILWSTSAPTLVGFSPDGHLVGELDGRTAQIRDVATGTVLAKFDSDLPIESPQMTERTLQWSAKSETFHVSYEMSIHPAKLVREQLSLAPPGSMYPTSADGHHRAYLDSASDTIFIVDLDAHKQVPLWAPASGRWPPREAGPVRGSRVSSMIFSPDGRRLVTYSARSTRQFDVTTGHVVAQDVAWEGYRYDGRYDNPGLGRFGRLDLGALPGVVSHEGATPDKSRVITVRSSSITVRNAADNTSRGIYNGDVPVAYVARNDSGAVVQLENGVTYRLSAAAPPTIVARATAPLGVALSDDGTVFAWIDASDVHFIAPGSRDITMHLHAGDVRGIYATPRGVTVVKGGVLHQLTSTGTQREVTLGDTGSWGTTLLGTPANDDIVVLTTRGEASMWNGQTGAFIATVTGSRAQWSRDGRRLIVLRNDDGIIVDPNTGTEISRQWVGPSPNIELRDDKAWRADTPSSTTYDFTMPTERHLAENAIVIERGANALKMAFFSRDRAFIEWNGRMEVVGNLSFECTRSPPQAPAAEFVAMPSEVCVSRLTKGVVQAFFSAPVISR